MVCTPKRFRANAVAIPPMPAPMMATSSNGPQRGWGVGWSHSLAGGMSNSSRSRASRASSSARFCGSCGASACMVTPEVVAGTTEVGIPNSGIVHEFACRSRQHDAPTLQDITVVGDLQGEMGVLLHHENGDAFAIDAADQ